MPMPIGVPVPSKNRSTMKPPIAALAIWIAPISDAPVPAICGTGSIAAAIAFDCTRLIAKQ